MIPRVCILVLGATIYAAVAQDWFVNFNNAVLIPNTAHPNRLIYDANNMPLVGTNYMAVLLYGANAASLTPAQAPARFRVPTTALPGTWQGGDRTLIGMGETPGTQVTMQVAVFDINQFASYAAAVAGGGILGRSSLFIYTIPARPLPTDPQDLINFDGFVIPEPAVPALGAVGANL